MIDVKSFSSQKKLLIFSLEPIPENEENYAIGNKAHSLIKLYCKSYEIPDSIFLDYSFFQAYRRLGNIPHEWIVRILSKNLGETLAIRSSANIEDSQHMSFAGAFTTVLYVPNTEKNLEQALIDCYQSVDKQRVQDLLARKNIPAETVQMGIIIQPLIEARISGIIFTTPPVNPTDDQYHIEYCPGCGDKLMGGILTGHSITLEKESGKIVRQNGSLLLTRSNMNQLWQAATKLEADFHFAQDVEFVIAKADNQIVFLQTRPITAFQYTSAYVIQQENVKLRDIFEKNFQRYGETPIISHNNICELFPIAIPLGYSIFKTIFAGTNTESGAISMGRSQLGYAPLRKNELADLFLTVGNQARMNLIIDALTFRLKDIKEDTYFNLLVKYYLQRMRKDPSQANYPEYGVYLQNPDVQLCKTFFGSNDKQYFNYFQRFFQKLKSENVPRFLESVPDFLKSNEQFYRQELLFDPAKVKFEDLRLKLDEYITYLRNNVAVKYVIIARLAYLSAFMVKEHLLKSIESNPFLIDGAEKLTGENYTQFVNHYSNLLLTSMVCPEDYKMPDQSEYERQVIKQEMTIEAFLKIFGHVGSLDISQPRLIENSKDFVRGLIQIRELKDAPDQQQKIMNPALSAKESNAFWRRYKKWDRTQFEDLKWWVEKAGIFMILRETCKFELLKIIYLIKKIVTELQTRLDFADLIYYLNWDELLQMLEADSFVEFRFEALKHKAYFEACKSIEVEKVIFDLMADNIKTKQSIIIENIQDYNIMDGNTIHHGEAEGVCLIARNPQDWHHKIMEYKQKGINNIIGVFPGVELSYYNLSVLKGILTENGGALAHAATIAREHNIPYISNIKIDRFKDGYFIIFDTSKHQVIYRRQD